MVSITPEAHEEIVRLLEEEIDENDDVTLRILLRPGWGGYNFQLALDEPTDNDKKFEQDGYTIVIDPRVTEMVGDITIEKHRWGLHFTTSNDRI